MKDLDLILKTLFEQGNPDEAKAEEKKPEEPKEGKEEEQQEEPKKIGYPAYNENLREMKHAIFNTMQFCRKHEGYEKYIESFKRLLAVLEKYTGQERPNLNQLGHSIQSAIVKVRDKFPEGSEEYQELNQEVGKFEKYV